MINLARLPLALAAALSISPALAVSSAHAQQQPSLQQADALGQDLFAKSGSTGMVLVVVRNQEVFVRGYGETALGNGQRPDAASLLRLCSLSKIFATDILTRLTADGTVALDDPLQKYAPSLHILVPARAGRSITLEDLATHTSGLPREVGPAPRGAAHFTFPDFAFRWHWLPAQHLKTTPGTAAAYSNIGFDLLGDALANAAQKPYAQLFAERITTPLGMSGTTFSPTPSQCARLLQGAHREGLCTDTQSSAGSAGVYSTATDMVTWLKYLLGTGAPAIPAQTSAAEAVYIAPSSLVSQTGLEHAGNPTGIGLGWMHISGAVDPGSPIGPSNPPDIIEKTGGGAGFLTYIALNQWTHTGIFLAVTDGPTETHLNVFKNANNLLLTLNALPNLPIEVRPAARPAAKSAAKPATKSATRPAAHPARKPHKKLIPTSRQSSR